MPYIAHGSGEQSSIYELACIKNKDFDCRAFADEFSKEKEDDPEYYRQWNECPFQNKEKRKLFTGSLEDFQVNEAKNIDLQHIQDLLTEKDTLTSKVSEMSNSLLKAVEEIAILQTDNEFLRTENSKLSESELLNDNDSVRLQVIDLNKKINEYYEPEIRKVQLVADKQLDILNAVISKTNSLLTELTQFLPTYAKGYGDVQKKIQDFKGYLETMRATPKDNILRGS
jgi:hypothetical protein